MFGLVQVRENRSIKRELANLRENRAQLLALIGEKNARLAETDSSSASSPIPVPAHVPSERRVERRRPARPDPTESTHLPYSFNHGSPNLKLVSLTFDGSAYANAADDILDTLMSRQVKATMFLTGSFIRRYPEIVRRMVREGHDMGNHTDRHPHLTSWARDRTHTTLPEVSESMLIEELTRANTLFKEVTGRSFDPIWRAPYGEQNREICLWGRKAGYLHVGWGQGRTWRENLDTNDWIPDEHTPGYHSPRDVYEKIIRRAESRPDGINGGIILLHLGTVRREPEKQVHRILGVLIDELRDQGYELVPIGRMVRESRAERQTAMREQQNAQ